MIEKEIIEEEINLWDYVKVVLKYKVMIVILVIGAALIAYTYSLTMPKIYSSTASVLPPEIDAKGTSSLAKLGRNLNIGVLPNLSGGGSTTDIVMAMLKSRRMAEDIINEFNLKKVEGFEYLIETIDYLRSNTKINVSREDVISIAVESSDKQRAADIANFYVANLNKMNEELELSSSKPIVRVLDIAKPAELKCKPIIRKNVMIAGMAAIMLGIILAFLRDYLAQKKK